MNGSGSRPVSSPSLRRNSVVDSSPIGACRYGRSSVSHSPRPNSRYMHTLTLASASFFTSARCDPSGKAMPTSAPIPSIRRRISARSDGMLNVPYIGPMMLTLGFCPSRNGRSGGTFFTPNCVHSQVSARSAACHWSSSIVRGRKRWMLVPSGVTPPPIISAIDPVTTTAGRSGSSVFHARFIAPSVPSRPSSCSPSPVTTIGSSCGGSASV